MAKRYVLTTKTPVPGNCNHLTKSGHYCANRVRTADHCAAGHTAIRNVEQATTASSVMVDAVPDIATSFDWDASMLAYGDRLLGAADALQQSYFDYGAMDSAERRHTAAKTDGALRAALLWLSQQSRNAGRFPTPEELATYAGSLAAEIEDALALKPGDFENSLPPSAYSRPTDAWGTAARTPRSESEESDLRRAYADGIQVALDILDEFGLHFDEDSDGDEDADGDAPDPLAVLDAAINSLPEGHRDRPGLVRARELLRTVHPAVTPPRTEVASQPLDERVRVFVERLRAEESAPAVDDHVRGGNPRNEGRILGLRECQKALGALDLDGATKHEAGSDLAERLTELRSRYEWLQERSRTVRGAKGPLNTLRYEGYSEGIEYALSLLEELGLVAKAVEVPTREGVTATE